MITSYTDAVPHKRLATGERFAGYLVERHLGIGGMGDVYQVRHVELDKSFALKVLTVTLGDDPTLVQRFKREMQTVSQLDHANIVMATDAGSLDGHIWFTMTLVPGTDAQRAINERGSGLPADHVVTIVEKVGAALDHAHRKGVLHRDIKPANILLKSGSDGDEDDVFLTDFGIAKAIEDLRPITTDPTGPMTLDYASPEQIRGEDLDSRTDIYSLGATMYALLTGQVPFPAPTIPAKMLKHLDEPPPRPTDIAPQLPAALDEVVARAMAKAPRDRFATCSELAAAARSAVASQTQSIDSRFSPTNIEPIPVLPHTRTTDQSSRGSTGRPRRRAIVLTTVAVIAVLATVGVLWRINTNEEVTTAGTTTTDIAATDIAAPGSTTPNITTAASTAAGQTLLGAAQSANSGETVPSSAQPLSQLLDPAPEMSPGTVGGNAVASAPAYRMQPKNCELGTRVISVPLDRDMARVTGNVQLDDGAPESTRVSFTATADGDLLQRSVLSPTEDASFDLLVTNKNVLEITLGSLGQGPCDSDDYLVFFTSALAYP